MSKKLSQQELENIAAELGVKIISLKDNIIEYEGLQWQPAANEQEFLCYCFDGLPCLNFLGYPFVLVSNQML